jgi:hypothetical protein
MSFRANSAKKFACPYPIIECAQCSEQLFVPDRSEYVDEHGVRHLWKCEACGYAFETTVSYAAELALA